MVKISTCIVHFNTVCKSLYAVMTTATWNSCNRERINFNLMVAVHGRNSCVTMATQLRFCLISNAGSVMQDNRSIVQEVEGAYEPASHHAFIGATELRQRIGRPLEALCIFWK